MNKSVFPFFIAVFLFSSPLFCEDYFRILSGEGQSFTLVREEVRQELDASVSNLAGILLGEGDYLITGEGTFLELASGDIRLMVGENSALSLDTLDLEQGSLITLNYGHVRGKKGFRRDGDLWIGGSDTVARLTEGDIGILMDYDMTLDQPEILTRLYSLDGRIEVMQKSSEPLLGEEKRVEYKAPVLIDMGEMVVSSNWEKDLPLVPSLFDTDYARYWHGHPFSGEEVIALVEIAEEQPSLTEEMQEKMEPEVIPDRDWDRYALTGKTALILGAVSMTGGAISYMAGAGDLGNVLTGFSLFNLSVGTGIHAYIFCANPAYREPAE